MKKLSMIQSILIIYKRPKNILNLVSLSVLLGISWTFSSVINNILEEWNFSVIEIGYVGLVMNGSGTIAGLVASLKMG